MRSQTRGRHVIYHTLEDATTALAAAGLCEVTPVLRTAPGAVAYAGAPYLKRLAEIAAGGGPGDAHLIADCGADAAAAVAALKAGWPAVVVTGSPAMAAKVGDIAAQLDAECYTRRPPALDLAGLADPFAGCVAWLERGARP
jgi:hypothetical protein